MATAFKGWALSVEGSRNAAERVAQLLHAALRRMQHVQLSRSMGRWVAHWAPTPPSGSGGKELGLAETPDPLIGKEVLFGLLNFAI